ncbi:hypothetical protein AP1_0112 [Aeromonas phage AP1]|nr:hypothetical protein AP1_0112 [Aeromonas phage AP1]
MLNLATGKKVVANLKWGRIDPIIFEGNIMILIGSRAMLECFYADCMAPTKDMDYDFIATEKEWSEYQARMQGRSVAVQNPNVRAFVVERGDCRSCYHEAYIIQPGSSDEMIADYMNNEHGKIKVANPGLLLAIKMAHRFKKNTRNFIKTMKSIHELRDFGVVMNEKEFEIFKKREKESLTYGHPKLNVGKKDFFTDDFYTMDHDTVHQAIAVGERPAYLSYMVDGEEVMTSKTKFEQCDMRLKLLGVYEEACVLALERCIVPFPGKVHPAKAFMMALEKVCTSITSGWFREFSWEHYTLVMDIYNEQTKTGKNYVQLFLKNQHLIKPFEG